MKLSYAVLAASLLVAIGSWGMGFDNWRDLTEVSNVMSLAGVIGGVILAWLGRSPIPPRSNGGGAP